MSDEDAPGLPPQLSEVVEGTQTTAPPVDSSRPTSMVAALLKAPAFVAMEIAQERGTLAVGIFFLVTGILFHAIFGFSVGLFSGWHVAVIAAVKASLIALGSLLLCFPSLYVFSSVGGAPLSLRQTFLLGSSSLAMVGILLIGLAPVAWLFAVSTGSLGFVVLLTLIIWLVCMGFAVKYVERIKLHLPVGRAGGISLWFVILILVSFQMTTCLRPILVPSKPKAGSNVTQKQFFLAHFASCFDN